MNKIIFEREKPDDSIGFNLWQAYNHWHRIISQKLNSVDLTHIQFVLLAAIGWLNNSEGDTTQIQVAQFAKVDVMMTSTVLRTLESKGLIKRSEHKTDTRAKCVNITEIGRKKLVEALKIVETADTDFFKILGKDIPAFNKSLLRLKNTIL